MITIDFFNDASPPVLVACRSWPGVPRVGDKFTHESTTYTVDALTWEHKRRGANDVVVRADISEVV